MVKTKLFYSNRTQAVRLSKDVALPADVTEVEIVANGRSRTISPAGSSWHEWWSGRTTVSDDFLTERDQPTPQERSL